MALKIFTPTAVLARVQCFCTLINFLITCGSGVALSTITKEGVHFVLTDSPIHTGVS